MQPHSLNRIGQSPRRAPPQKYNNTLHFTYTGRNNWTGTGRLPGLKSSYTFSHSNFYPIASDILGSFQHCRNFHKFNYCSTFMNSKYEMLHSYSVAMTFIQTKHHRCGSAMQQPHRTSINAHWRRRTLAPLQWRVCREPTHNYKSTLGTRLPPSACQDIIVDVCTRLRMEPQQ